MLRIWQKTEKQKLEPVGMGTAFPFLKEKNHVVSIIGGGGKTTLVKAILGTVPHTGELTLAPEVYVLYPL